MLIIDRDPETGQTCYIVCNDAGLCLIRTTSSAIAYFVEQHTKGTSVHLRLNVGGDPGTRKDRHIWQHVRRFVKN
jgi:hypothetical protein